MYIQAQDDSFLTIEARKSKLDRRRERNGRKTKTLKHITEEKEVAFAMFTLLLFG